MNETEQSLPAPDAPEEKKHRREYRRLRDMRGTERVLRIAALCFAGAILAASVVWAVYRFVTLGTSDKELRGLIGVVMAVLAVLPFLVERLFRFNFSGFILLMYYVFLLFAGYIGSALGMYVPWRRFYYDKIVHGIFGYIACIAGLYAFCKLTDYSSASPVFVAVFCFVVSLCCASCWEIIEFSCDRLIGSQAQGIKVFDGFATVEDTMGDIVANFIGAILFTVHYVVHRAARKNLLIGSMVADFTDKR